MHKIAFLLFQLRLERPFVEGEQDLSLLNVVAFFKVNAGKFTSNLGFDSNHGIRFNSADRAHLDGYVFLLDECCDYWNGRGSGSRSFGAITRGEANKHAESLLLSALFDVVKK